MVAGWLVVRRLVICSEWFLIYEWGNCRVVTISEMAQKEKLLSKAEEEEGLVRFWFDDISSIVDQDRLRVQ